MLGPASADLKGVQETFRQRKWEKACEARKVLKGTVEQEPKDELVEQRQSRVRQPPGGRDRRGGQEGLNLSNWEGLRAPRDPHTPIVASCSGLLSTASGHLCAAGDKV